MSRELLVAFLLFAIVTLYTPGPNNVMLMTSGLNFGFARTLPHIFGVSFGFALMVFLVGVGLGAIFRTFPVLYDILKYAGSAYLLYLAWMIARAPVEAPSDDGRSKGRPLTFLEGALFQWINAKGWVIAVGGVTTYAALTTFPYNIMLLASVFGAIGVTSCVAWAALGAGLSRWLRHPRAVRIFNVTMALLLVASLYPVIAG